MVAEKKNFVQAVEKLEKIILIFFLRLRRDNIPHLDIDHQYGVSS